MMLGMRGFCVFLEVILRKMLVSNPLSLCSKQVKLLCSPLCKNFNGTAGLSDCYSSYV